MTKFKMMNFQLELVRALSRDLVGLYQWKRTCTDELKDWADREIAKVKREHKKARLRSKAYLIAYKRERGLL